MGSWSLISSRENAADELARHGALLLLFAVPNGLSLTFRVHFSRSGGALFDTQFPLGAH